MTKSHLPRPPTKDGVSPSRLYLQKLTCPPVTLFDFLCQKFPHICRDEWLTRFNEGQILAEDLKVLTSDTPYCHGKMIYYYRFLEDEAVVPFHHQILFENDEFMVVDKPHFLAVSPAGQYVKETLLTRLKVATGNADLSPIHRLDRETAGLILISKNVATRHLYQALFAHHAIEKTYHAIAGHQDLSMPTEVNLHLERGDPFYVMRVNEGKPANTHTQIDVLAVKGGTAKYELLPTTGKLHQLRVHLNHLGIPIKGDPYYPTVMHKSKDDFSQPLQLLAKRLAFNDPLTGGRHVFESRQDLYL